MSRTAVVKWCNSSAVRIPKQVMSKAGFSEGDQVTFDVEDTGVIVLRTVKRIRTLDKLVAAITARNRHKETEWGEPTGNEAW